MITLSLKVPWPPSANRYWRHVGKRVLISREAKAYRTKIIQLSYGIRPSVPLLGRIGLKIEVFPPDRRKRDIDNLMKILIDSLQAAGYYYNDCQIDRILIERMPRVVKGGEMIVEISDIG